jgi:hypothetical protein
MVSDNEPYAPSHRTAPDDRRVGSLYLGVTGAESKGQQELLIFLSASAGQQVDVSSEENVDAEDFFPTADYLYAYNRDRFRFLGEYLWTSEEPRPRAPPDRSAGPATRRCCGSGAFTSLARCGTPPIHHGQYMQTSITRPVFEQWEDDGGFLPAHSTGLMLQSGHGLNGQGALEYALSIGTGQIFNGTELVPFDLVDPEADDYELAYAFQLAYLPASLGNDKLGVLGDPQHHRGRRRRRHGSQPDRRDQARNLCRLELGSVAGPAHRLPRRGRLEGPGPRSDGFLLRHLRAAEYAFDQRWTAYARARRK